MSRGLAGILAAGVLLVGAAGAGAAGLTLLPAYTDSQSNPVSQPTYVTAAPGDSTRLFVVERPGVIRVAVNGVMQDTDFLDIHTRVSQSGEGGLLSMAFDPNYQANGLFYVYYATGTSPNNSIRIEEFHSSDSNTADSTGRVVLQIPHPNATNHYGGTIHFGPGGYLYIAPGDGGTGGANAPDTKSLLGKVLRIDPHQTSISDPPYSIPNGNPFKTSNGSDNPLCTSSPGAKDCPEIYALGLRNPFRWSFDRASGDITIADVGQGSWEEVDWVPAAGGALAGANFDWPCWEGPVQYNGCTDPSHVLPVFSYPHTGGSVAITGGVVVRDPALTPLLGRYLYADFYDGQIRSLVLASPNATDDRGEALPIVPQLVAFNDDPDGHVYVVSLAGAVYRIACGADCPPPPAPPPPGAGPTPPGGASSPPTSGTGTAPPSAAVSDTRAPRLFLEARRDQDVLRLHSVNLLVGCDEACIVRVTATARTGLAARVYRVRGKLVRLRAGKRLRVRLAVSRRVLRALRRSRGGRLRLLVRARDAAGNLRVGRRTVLVLAPV